MNSKTAVVTGAGRGIGKEIAMALAKENYNVVVNSRNPEHANSVANEIKSLGKNAIGVGGDVAKEEDCTKIIQAAINHFKRIDLLVNNAGIQKPIPLNSMSVEEWDKVMNVNLRGVFMCSREAAKHMLKNGGGSIINISSVHQVIPKPLYVHYASSKGGLNMLTKTMALELARHNIRVNAVAPGAIATDMNKEIVNNQDKMKELNEFVPMGRIGNAEEVASAVIFLASDKASYITGTTLFVDGGLTLYPSYGIELKEGSEEVH
ncbi:MAG: SDR family NAD(P)-dependent oxidoreductase [Nitrososphaerales archaeon]